MVYETIIDLLLVFIGDWKTYAGLYAQSAVIYFYKSLVFDSIMISDIKIGTFIQHRQMKNKMDSLSGSTSTIVTAILDLNDDCLVEVFKH